MFRNRRRGLAVLAMATAVVTALSACSGDSGSGGDSPTSGDTINIAMTGPLTGDNGQYGQDQLNGLQLAVDELNEAGGIKSGPNKGKKFKLSQNDDASDTNQGASIAQSLCDDTSVLAEFGPGGSAIALAVAPIYSRCEMPMIMPYVDNPKITQQGFTNQFRVISNSDQLALASMEALIKVAGNKKIGIIYSNEDYGKGMADAAEKAIKEFGGEVAAKEGYTVGSTKDYSSILQAVKSSGADAMYFAVTYTDAGLLTKQARDIGFEGQLSTAAGNATPTFLELAGPAAEGIQIVGFYDPAAPSPELAKFQENYTAKFGKAPGESSAIAYSAFQIMVKALEDGATDRKSLIEKMHANEDVPTLLGPITFNKAGDPEGAGATVVFTAQGGQFVNSGIKLEGK